MSLRPRLFRPLLATVVVLAACDGSNNPTEPVPPEIEVLAGDQQTGRVTDVLEEPLSIRVLAEGGGPAEGVPISWIGDEHAHHAFLVDPDSVTDADGRARTGWRLGQRAGEQRLRVEAEGVGAYEFTATATPHVTFWIDVDVEPEGTDALGRHPLVIQPFDRYGNESEGVPVDQWVSSDSAVAFIEGDEIVIGAEGIANLEGIGLPWEPQLSIHVRDGKAFLMNLWSHWLPPVTQQEPAAEGRTNRIVVQGTALGQGSAHDIRQGFWESIDGGFAFQALMVRRTNFGDGAQVWAGFRGSLFPVEPGDYVVELMDGQAEDGHEPLPFEPEWIFEVTVPD